MKLTLMNGYPYPYPKNVPPSEQDEIADASSQIRLVLDDVKSFQWLHDPTVEFTSHEAYVAALEKTGWESCSTPVLKAATSIDDGYRHPAITARGYAYCGFMLEP